MADHYRLISDHPMRDHEEVMLRSLESLHDREVDSITVVATTEKGEDMYINSSDGSVRGALDAIGALLIDVICQVVENNFDVEPLTDDEAEEEYV